MCVSKHSGRFGRFISKKQRGLFNLWIMGHGLIRLGTYEKFVIREGFSNVNKCSLFSNTQHRSQ